MFLVNFHKNQRKSLCFIAKMSRRLRKHAKLIVFFDFSNQAGARVPIFTPKMKISRFAELARQITRKWDFRRRSRPRELAQRSQDDVSLNKLPQIKKYMLVPFSSLPRRSQPRAHPAAPWFSCLRSLSLGSLLNGKPENSTYSWQRTGT